MNATQHTATVKKLRAQLAAAKTPALADAIAYKLFLANWTK